MHKFPYYKNLSLNKSSFFFCLVLAASYFCVWFLGKNPWQAMVPIILVGVLALFYLRSWKLFLVYIFIAILTSGLEILFITYGFWAYKVDSFWSIPIYLPFVWGNIGILCVGGLKGIMMISGQRFLHSPPRLSSALILTLLGLIALVLSVRNFAGQPFLLVLILLCIDILYVVFMRSIPLALVGIIALTCGTIGDLTSVWLGVWNYSAISKIAGVPPYVFIGWDIMGLMIAGLYLTLDAPDAPLPHWMKKNN